MPAGSFSLCLRAVVFYACGPLSLRLWALVFHAYGPFSMLLIYIAVMSLISCFLELQLDILDSNQKSQFFGHKPVAKRHMLFADVKFQWEAGQQPQ